MNFLSTKLAGVTIIEPDVFGDQRGYFLETYHLERYRDAGIDLPFVQDNHSYSRYGTLRGLHAQYRRPQGKLVRALEGEVFDVVVDIESASPTFGQWAGVVLSGENLKQLYIPPGYAHGFCVLSDTVHFQYKCTDLYDPHGEISIRWNDPALAIAWPVSEPSLSAKDGEAMTFAEAVAFLSSVEADREATCNGLPPQTAT